MGMENPEKGLFYSLQTGCKRYQNHWDWIQISFIDVNWIGIS